MDMKKTTKGSLAGIFILLFAVIWVSLTRGRTVTPSENSGRRTKPVARANDAAEPGRAAARSAMPANATDTPRGWTRHTPDQLVDFILPVFAGNGATLGESIGLLEEAYREACFRSREKPLPLRITTTEDPQETLTFSLRGKSLTACLKHLAALAGLTVHGQGPDFELLSDSSPSEPASLEFDKHAPIKQNLRALAGMEKDDSDVDWEPLLRSAGFLREAGSSISTGPNGKLILRGTRAEIDRVSSTLELALESSVQLKFQVRHVTSSTPIDVPRDPLSAVETGKLLKNLAERKETTVNAMPSVLAREGELATIEVIREVPREDGSSDWTGTRQVLSGARTGLKVATNNHSERRPDSTGGPSWNSGSETAAPAGRTVVERLGSKDGEHHYQITTTLPVTATGHPLGETDTAGSEQTGSASTEKINALLNNPAPSAKPVPGKAGFVFSPYNNNVVDVNGIPSGTLVMDPSYMSNERKFFRVP